MTDPVRREVWIALSDLFLDVDPSVNIGPVERVCRASGYDVATLDTILRDEVAPVCLSNLMSVTGNWTGFDQDELVVRIEAERERVRLFAGIRRVLRARLVNWFVPEWRGIADRLSQSDKP